MLWAKSPHCFELLFPLGKLILHEMVVKLFFNAEKHFSDRNLDTAKQMRASRVESGELGCCPLRLTDSLEGFESPPKNSGWQRLLTTSKHPISPSSIK